MAREAEQPTSRNGHAVLDLRSRVWKAQKIERLLEVDSASRALRMLEVGTGSGGIANYFGRHESGRFEVHAVDIEDCRLIQEGFQFSLVKDAALPFPDNDFDVVISNHVIEHVGDEAEQLRHLLELRRVLRPGGVGYFAVPNRWMLIEPHYRLIFLSWLPKQWRSRYLNYWRSVARYDCEPLDLPTCERFLSAAGFEFRNICVAAMRLTLEIERHSSVAHRLLSFIPDGYLSPFARLIPTLIYRLRIPKNG